jgi:hypothetical protein
MQALPANARDQRLMPDQIQITHQPRTMTTDSADRALSQPLPEISATGALTDIQLWELLPERLEQNLLAMVQIAAPHHNLRPIDLLQNIAPDFVNYARAVLKAKPQAARPSEKDLYDLAAEFHGDPVPAMRRALELWGNPLRGVPAPGENLATPPFPEPGEAKELHPLWYLVEFLEGHSSFCRQTEPTDELAQILSDSATLLQQQEAELAALRGAPGPTFQDAIRLAQGCHDYSGGHSGAEGEAWHGAIDTVVDVLKRAAAGPWDSQIRAVYGVGVEAGAGEVAELGPVAELDDQHREAVHQAVAEALGGAYDCQRVWEAWGVGTMGPDDFVPVAEDSDRVAEIADAAIEAFRAIPQPATQAGEVALAGNRRSAESLQLAHESCRSLGTKNGDCPDDEICWLDMLPCSHYENCATPPAPQAGEVEA